MSLARYDDYKKSEIDLLVEIPKGWKVSRLKALGEIRYGLGQPPKQMENGLPIIRATNVSCGKITTKDMLFVDPNDLPYDRNPILKTNEIIVVRSGAYTGDSAIIPEEYAGSVTGYDMVFTPKYIYPKFIAFSILSNYIFKDQLVISSLRAAQPHLNKEELGNTLVSIPPLTEQTVIATYLKSKISVIDRKVALLKQKITHYQHLRKSLINETVCRGLDKNVKLKDCGIEWIGRIPEHWAVKRLKDVIVKNDGGVWGDFSDEGTVVLRSTEIELDGGWKLDNPAKLLLSEREIKSSKLIAGDLLITKSSGSELHIGKTALVNKKIERLICCYSNFMQRIRPGNKANPKFLLYLLNSTISRHQFILLSKSTTGLGNLSAELLNHLTLFCPPLAEQKQIGHYLDEKSHKIDNIVTNIKAQIATLKELRKTLINEVVTGKIKVSG